MISETHGYQQRDAINKNQWVRCAELQVQKISKSMPSTAANLRAHHAARSTSISKRLPSIRHLQDSPHIPHMSTAEQGRTSATEPKCGIPTACLSSWPQDIGAQLQETFPSRVTLPGAVRTYFKSQHAISPGTEKVSLWIHGHRQLLSL